MQAVLEGGADVTRDYSELNPDLLLARPDLNALLIKYRRHQQLVRKIDDLRLDLSSLTTVKQHLVTAVGHPATA